MGLPAKEDFAGALAALTGSWTQQKTTDRVQRNGSGVGNMTGTEAFVFWNADLFSPNQYSQLVIAGGLSSSVNYVEVTVTASGTLDANVNLYTFYTDGVNGAGHTEFAKIVAGVTTALCNFSPAAAFTTNDIIRVERRGNVFTFYKNGVQLVPSTGGTSFTDASLAGGGSAGLGLTGTSVTVDNWEGGALGQAIGYVGSQRQAMVGRGPFDRLGFLKQRGYDYTAPATSAPAITGTGNVEIAAAFGMSGQGIAGIIATGAIAIALALSGTCQQTQSGTGNVSIAAPSIQGTGVQTITGTGSVAIPTFGLSGTGSQTQNGTGSLAIAKPALSGSGGQSQSGSGGVVIASPSLSGTLQQTQAGTGSVAIQSPALSGVGQQTQGGTGSVAIVTPAPSGTGTTTDVSGSITGTGAVAIPSLNLSGSGNQTQSGSGDVALSLSVSGSGIVGNIGDGSVAVPPLGISGSDISTDVTGSGSVAIPPFSIGATVAPDDTIAVGVFGFKRHDKRKIAAQEKADAVVVTAPETYHGLPSAIFGRGAMMIDQPGMSGSVSVELPVPFADILEASAGSSEGGGLTVATRNSSDNPRADPPVRPNAERPDLPSDAPAVLAGSVPELTGSADHVGGKDRQTLATPEILSPSATQTTQQAIGGGRASISLQISGVGTVTASPKTPAVQSVEQDDDAALIALMWEML